MPIFDSGLLAAPRNLKDFIHQYKCKKDIFDLHEGHVTTDLTTNKNFFFNNYIMDVFLFITAIFSVLVVTWQYIYCENIRKIKMLVDSLVIQQIKDAGAVTQEEINTECKIQTYISLALTFLA